MNDPMQTVDEPEREPAVVIPAPSLPHHIGRYRVERILGQGGFGLVYLAHDDQLQRPVAVKIPHRLLVSRPEEAEAYLTEARTVAKLDHPNIVAVYDVGSNKEHPIFIVCKYIEGITLAKRMKDYRPSVAEAVELTTTVAETLHYTHKQGIIHRDIKPSNILLDRAGQPFVADFGLALREQAEQVPLPHGLLLCGEGRPLPWRPTAIQPHAFRRRLEEAPIALVHGPHGGR
jgi:serine/threonine protein kinase